MAFSPNFRYLVDAVENRRPERLPLYEHLIDPSIMAAVLRCDLSMDLNDPASIRRQYRYVCRFWKEMTYDTVSFEAGVCGLLPGHGAIFGGRPGPIQNRDEFDRYPFEAFEKNFWEFWTPQIEALSESLPTGMKLVGGIGNGVFEISEDLVGYESLCLLMFEDPELFNDLLHRIGGLMIRLWSRLLRDYGDLFCVGRMGDDLGYKTSTLMSPDVLRASILPQYKRIIDLVHQTGKPFLLHSCGCIFNVMDDLIEIGIDAKHSNEDQIAPFPEWIARYGKRIGLLGGIDLDRICRGNPRVVMDDVVQLGTQFRSLAKGFAIGSGNSIPDYVPIEGYLAMIEGAKEIRRREKISQG